MKIFASNSENYFEVFLAYNVDSEPRPRCNDIKMIQTLMLVMDAYKNLYYLTFENNDSQQHMNSFMPCFSNYHLTQNGFPCQKFSNCYQSHFLPWYYPLSYEENYRHFLMPSEGTRIFHQKGPGWTTFEKRPRKKSIPINEILYANPGKVEDVKTLSDED